MRSFSVWLSAERPNYNTNIDLRFPYSETINYNADSDFHVEKIRFNNLIQHVDYWGEGKVVCGDGIRGFSNCYNVNQWLQLVSNGPDVDRKIPNRIPVTNDGDCDTSDFIEDNSVLTVTVAGARITSSCAKDIARIVNNDRGKVVMYWEYGDSKEIAELTDELEKKGLIPSPNAALPVELQGLTYYDSHVAFLDLRTIKKAMADEMYNNVVKDYYDTAVNIAQSIGVESGEFTNEIVTRLISTAPRKVMSFAYKLWHGGAREIVRNHFPKCFQNIFNEDAVTIVNKEYQLPITLREFPKDQSFPNRVAMSNNNRERNNEAYSWKVHPAWSSDGVTFKLYNIDTRMYLKLPIHNRYYKEGIRSVLGSFDYREGSRSFYFEPMVENDILTFFIIHCEYGERLKLSNTLTSDGDRYVWGYTRMDDFHNRFCWVIAEL